MNIEFLPLPKELHWNIIKFLKHPLAETCENHPAYNLYLSSEEDTYTNIDDRTYLINDLITFYDIWKMFRDGFSDTSSESYFESDTDFYSFESYNDL